MQWDLELVDGVGVLRLSGYLGESVVRRFHGGFDWARARCGDVLVIDLSGLLGWSPEGEAAIVDAAGRPGSHNYPLMVCGLRDHAAPLLSTSCALGFLRIFPDLKSALSSLGVSYEPQS